MLEIGIVGYGVVGQATHKMLLEVNNVKILDPNIGHNDDLSNCNIIFICINEKDHTMENLNKLVNGIAACNKKAIIVIRTTVIPGTTDQMSIRHKREFVFMPEFLTERSAEYDAFHPDKVVIGTDNKEVFGILRAILKDIIDKERIIQVKPLEAEITKLALNSLYTIKVVFAEELNTLAENYGADYNNIYKAFCLDRYTNEEHLIAGKDGYRGAGGKCLPKDIGFLCYAGEKALTNLTLTNLARQLNTHYLRGKRDEKN